jgi:regulator of protease activity HflC (stomatin/prohibitin superfamily)
MFVLFIILAVIAVGVFIFGSVWARREKAPYDSDPKLVGRWWKLGAIVPVVLALVFGFFSVTYTQDAGESNVLKDITGNIVGQNDSTGLQFKAPWVDTVTYSIRNQQVVYAGTDGQTTDNSGGSVTGPQITVQDADGVSSNIDIALRYSIKPGSVIDIYRQFQSEDNFKKSFIEQDVRSVVRSVPNKFHTLDLLTNRAAIEAGILDALQQRWASAGVTVDSISLQEIRVPDSVRDSYAAAQQAQINVTTEQANLEAAKVKAQQTVNQAQADADANALLNASLTPQILQQKYIDAINNGKATFVVPEGTTPLLTVPSQ